MTKKLKILLLALLVMLSVPTSATSVKAAPVSTEESQQATQASGSVNIAMYRSWTPFYEKSPKEPMLLGMTSDTISLVGYCEGDEVDTLICYIWGDEVQKTITFEADGHVKTEPCHLPAGEYEIVIYGSKEIKKTDAYVILSVLN